MKSDLVDVSGEIRDDTRPLAYLFFDGTKTVWLPKQYCEWDPDSKTMAMPEWLALDKELI